MASETVDRSMAPDADAGLVGRAKGGDFGAFEELVGKYERELYSLAMRILHRSAEAEEVVQEAFLAVVEHLREFAGRSTFRTWLGRIATNQALKVLRKRQGLKTVSLTPQGGEDDYGQLPHPDFIAQWQEMPEEIAQRREVRAVLDEAMGKLDEKYRLVFLLRDVEGLSTEETAELMGISPGNVKVRLLRARLMLREELTRRFGDEKTRVRPSHEH